MAILIQLYKNGNEILGTDGILKLDGRFSKSTIYKKVRERNNSFSANFPHKIADQYAIYANRIGGSIGGRNNI